VIQEDFDALRAVVSRIVEHAYDGLTCPERVALLEALERENQLLAPEDDEDEGAA
jgi:hypothetical protein